MTTTLNEIELAARWGMSPKTLQRWRAQNVGPEYLKLGKKMAVSNLKCNTREFNERLRSGGDLPGPGPRFVVESSSPVSGVAWC